MVAKINALSLQGKAVRIPIIKAEATAAIHPNFSHIGGMGISFSLAASLEAPFAQLLEMLSWIWQSKSHRISHCFRHFRVFLAASAILNLQNEMRLWSLRGQAHYPCRINFGISQQLWARWWKFQQQWEMIPKFDKQTLSTSKAWQSQARQLNQNESNAPWQRLRLFPLMLTRYSAQGPWLLENAEQLQYIKVLT